MTDEHSKKSPENEPSGFTPHSGGLASEFAREQGWQTNEAERTKSPDEKQDFDGGTDYDYGARDFGDSAVDTSKAQSTDENAGGKRNSPEKKP